MSEDLLAKLLKRVKSDPPEAGPDEGGPSSESMVREAPVPRNVADAATRTGRRDSVRQQESAPEEAAAGDDSAEPAGDGPVEPADEPPVAGNIDWLEPEADGLGGEAGPVVRDRQAAPEGAAERPTVARDADGTDDTPPLPRSAGDTTATTAASTDASRDLPPPPLLARTAKWFRSHEDAPLVLLLSEGIFAGFLFIVVIMLVLGLLGVPPALTAAVAGYFGGRRAGDPVRAAIAALLPFLLLVALFSMAHQGWLPGLFDDDVLTPQGFAEELQAKLGHDPDTPGVWGPLAELPDSDSTVFLMVAAFAVLGGLLEGMLRRLVKRMVREQQERG